MNESEAWGQSICRWENLRDRGRNDSAGCEQAGGDGMHYG